ncbi:TetR/AcrR family transcriptional regulator [Tessaracoccus sp. OS52]|uniref:TetR/AcrR family transcriptional regulator n=1 Tax=Tessaracoccus sp. OS52 TaxID=2886691 RepID=UPI001D11A889|nr:TetR/AcrR family transcriptional regulator [Tessaracoccus sp. OS52]MCC2593505.1 TetR/AcrR family transcriptional regulator [Tessaracoccus sp. OS52]
MNTTTASDGRATRWEGHNLQRRRELVEATLRAIRKHGPGVGMDEVAAQAGTSKTVIYRHFGGRTGLYTAVVESVQDFIRSKLAPSLDAATDIDPSRLVRQLTDTYLSVVERDPEIYQFVVTRPLGTDPVVDPVTGITGRIGDEVSAAFRVWLKANDLDPRAANTWGHGVVGFVWAIADKWITTGHQRPRADIVEFTARLFEPAFGNQRPTPRTTEGSTS